MYLKSKYDKDFVNKYQGLFETAEIDEYSLTDENIFNADYYPIKRYFLLLVVDLFNAIKDNSNLPYAELFLQLDETLTELKDVDIARIIMYALGENALIRTIEELDILDKE